VYATSDPYPIAVCSGRRRPDGTPVPPGERTYSSRATIKHISFGGPGLDSDIYLSTGSDDFRGYVWKLPPTAELLARRTVMEDDDTPFDPPEDFVGFTLSDEDEKLYSPVELAQPIFRLGGHQSIVNSALWHPTLPRIVTCGIESKVVLHSPFTDIDGCEKVDSNKVRKRLGFEERRSIMRGQGEFPEPLSEGEELNTILSFDRCVPRNFESKLMKILIVRSLGYLNRRKGGMG
jgi:WD repeat-containing protein 22